MKNHELAMDALIDLDEEKGKLEKEIVRLENEIKRCSGMLKILDLSIKHQKLRSAQKKKN